jgi:hypothetical protein
MELSHGKFQSSTTPIAAASADQMRRPAMTRAGMPTTRPRRQRCAPASAQWCAAATDKANDPEHSEVVSQAGKGSVGTP